MYELGFDWNGLGRIRVRVCRRWHYNLHYLKFDSKIPFSQRVRTNYYNFDERHVDEVFIKVEGGRT